MSRVLTPEQRAAHAARQRRYRQENPEARAQTRREYRERNREKLRAYQRKYQERNRDWLSKAKRLTESLEVRNARLAALRLARPKSQKNWGKEFARRREKYATDRLDPEFREKRRRYWRRQYNQEHPMSPAAQADLLARAKALAPASLLSDIRDEVIAMTLAAVIDGRFPRKITAADVRLMITEHFRQFSKFNTVSLDQVVHEGASRGQLMGIY